MKTGIRVERIVENIMKGEQIQILDSVDWNIRVGATIQEGNLGGVLEAVELLKFGNFGELHREEIL